MPVTAHPHQLFAPPAATCWRAAPEAAAFKVAKARWDPGSRLSNRLWAKYL